MSTDHDVARIVRSWLDEGVTVVPDRVLDAVLEQVPATHQRRAWWPARRFPIMNNMVLRVGLAGAPVIVIALLGMRLLPANQVGGPGPTATPTPVPTPVPSLNDQPSLNGRYSVNSGLQEEVSVSVPSGWIAGGDWVVKGPKNNDLPDGMALRFYTVSNLFKNPSSFADGLMQPPPGPTANDLVQAIARQSAWDASAPNDTVIDGRPAKHIQLTIPQDAKFDSRDGGAFYLFEGAVGSGEVWGFSPGQIFDIYAVDVGGQRLVMDAFHYPGTSAAEVAALHAVVATVKIGPSP
jgi:hypothetical protein